MRNVAFVGLILSVFLAAALPAAAQSAPKAEVFLGGSVLRDSSTTYGGWNASLTGNVNSWLGVEADFAGLYNSPIHFYSYTFGPRVAMAQDTGLIPFAHATFGAGRIGASGFNSINGFTGYIGGGMDYVPREHIAIRLIQIDAALRRFSGVNSTGTRLSFGVVFRLGNR